MLLFTVLSCLFTAGGVACGVFAGNRPLFALALWLAPFTTYPCLVWFFFRNEKVDL